MKFKYVLLLGRAGCGKSAVYREFERRIIGSGRATTVERMDDFPKLWVRFEKDNALEKEGEERVDWKRLGENDFALTNESLMDEILQELGADVLQGSKPDHVIFVEFARPDYVESLQSFDKRVLERSLVVYIDVSFETCWARNVARHEKALALGTDDHLTPRHEMERLYRYDDRDALVEHLKDQDIPVTVLDNEPDGEEYLRQQVETIFQELF